MRQALVARQLFQRDRHYLVQDGRVQIIDEYTGRLMPDRSWEQGCTSSSRSRKAVAVTAHHETLARISYQRFFRRYRRLAGMTGTAREVAGELWAVYGLPVVRVPTNRPSHARGAPRARLSVRRGPVGRGGASAYVRCTPPGGPCWSAPARWRPRRSWRRA